MTNKLVIGIKNLPETGLRLPKKERLLLDIIGKKCAKHFLKEELKINVEELTEFDNYSERVFNKRLDTNILLDLKINLNNKINYLDTEFCITRATISSYIRNYFRLIHENYCKDIEWKLNPDAKFEVKFYPFSNTIFILKKEILISYISKYYEIKNLDKKHLPNIITLNTSNLLYDNRYKAYYNDIPVSKLKIKAFDKYFILDDKKDWKSNI